MGIPYTPPAAWYSPAKLSNAAWRVVLPLSRSVMSPQGRVAVQRHVPTYGERGEREKSIKGGQIHHLEGGGSKGGREEMVERKEGRERRVKRHRRVQTSVGGQIWGYAHH